MTIVSETIKEIVVEQIGKGVEYECDEHGIAVGIGYSSIRFPTRFEKQGVSCLRVIGKCVAEEL